MDAGANVRVRIGSHGRTSHIVPDAVWRLRMLCYEAPDPLIERVRELRLDPNRRTSMAKFSHDMPALRPPASLELVKDAERRLGFALPPLLRTLYTEIGNGGFGPGYGLWGIGNSPDYDWITFDPPDDCEPSKAVTICEWGCANWSAIDCSTEEGEMVFSHDRPDLRDEIREGISFRQWMQDWADGVDLWARVYPGDRA
jgi:hypothetical protein